MSQQPQTVPNDDNNHSLPILDVILPAEEKETQLKRDPEMELSVLDKVSEEPKTDATNEPVKPTESETLLDKEATVEDVTITTVSEDTQINSAQESASEEMKQQANELLVNEINKGLKSEKIDNPEVLAEQATGVLVECAPGATNEAIDSESTATKSSVEEGNVPEPEQADSRNPNSSEKGEKTAAENEIHVKGQDVNTEDVEKRAEITEVSVNIDASNEDEDDDDIEFQVILNDDPVEIVSINGIPQLIKDEIVAPYEVQAQEATVEVKTDKNAAPEAESTVISLVSDDSEVTYGSVAVPQPPGEVTFDEQETHEVMILGDEQMLMMDNEEFDHPDTIEVNFVEDEKEEGAESIEEDEEEEEEGEGEIEEESDEEPRPLHKKRKQRRFKSKAGRRPRLGDVQIPCHVLGRNVEKPLNDTVRNGKVLLKPRLGVKIPYRNLTSQIVSKQEIAEEIMERSRLKQSNADSPAGGDVFFAKKLTQRLAKKLIPESDKRAVRSGASKPVASTSSASTRKDVAVKEEHNKVPPGKPDVSHKIRDNSDLIALLEGDDEPEWNTSPTRMSPPPPPPKRSAEWERETALKQLRELPRQGKGFGPRMKITNTSSPARTAAQSKMEAKKQSAAAASAPAPKEDKSPAPEPKDDVNTEPRFSSSLVTKTYTRKRKPSEDILKPILTQTKKTTAAAAAPLDDEDASTPPVLSPQKEPPERPTIVPLKSPKLPMVLTPVPKAVVMQKMSPVSVSSKQQQQKPSPAMPALKPIQKSPAVGGTDKKQPTQPSLKPQESSTMEVNKQTSPNTYISKSSRIVKRKKIWDPDEVRPAFKTSPVKPSKLSPPDSAAPPSEKKAAASKSADVAVTSAAKESAVTEKKAAVPTVLRPSNEKATPSARRRVLKRAIAKRRQPRRLTEVDRLLMDEGAVNLLYSVQTTAEELQYVKKTRNQKDMISLDRVERDLWSKANEIKMQMSSTKDAPISLRKKEGPTAAAAVAVSPVREPPPPAVHGRKKSRDSGSAHSPPASPAYSFAQHAEASRIIRRHSSSSFSSENNEGDENHAAAKPQKTPVFAEPQRKRHRAGGGGGGGGGHQQQEKGDRSSSSIGVDKQLLNEEMARNFNRAPADDPRYSPFETFNVRKFERLVQIILVPASSNGQTTLSVQVLLELIEVLNLLEKDDSCGVIVVSSSGSSFCQGIDYKELASGDKELRKTVAEDYALRVRQFLMTLARFPKILVAGVHGHTIGLGVTMLPLFDMVLASDTATFSTPYTHLGCAAEGGVLLTLPYIMHNALASELFFASRKLTAAEALRLGLVTRTLWPDKFQEELISALKIISNQSSQSMQGIKKQLRHNQQASVEASLKSESSMLVRHWQSEECQNNFNSYSLENK